LSTLLKYHVKTVDLMKKGLRLPLRKFITEHIVKTVDLMKKGLRLEDCVLA